jgi:hypothetical protein
LKADAERGSNQPLFRKQVIATDTHKRFGKAVLTWRFARKIVSARHGR